MEGLKFGKLTVVSDTGKRSSSRSKIWKCLCECGVEKEINTTRLTSGEAISCGCHKLKYVAKLGQQFGSLVYLGEAESIVTPYRTTRAGYFSCICGEEIVAGMQIVMSGRQTSCGCRKGKKGIKDITGDKFGRLTAIQNTGKRITGGYIWLCECDCGTMKEVPIGALSYGSVLSCGCLRIDENSVHGMSNTPTWRSWDSMLERCKNPKYNEWYGDVSVCEEWSLPDGQGFVNFYNDMGERPDGMTLNRKNGAKVYNKGNCEWATLSMQSYDQKKSKVNTSGRTGVSQVKQTGRWVASIKKNGITTVVYRGDSFEAACEARTKAEIEYFGFSKE